LIRSRLTYNKSEQFAGLEDEGMKCEIVDKTTCAQTNVGNYEIVLALRDKENYEWKDTKTNNNRSVWFIIEKIVNNDNINDVRETTYGELLSNIMICEESDVKYDEDGLIGNWAWHIPENADGTVGNAGTRVHTAVFTPQDPVNYQSRTVQVTFNVAKKLVIVPTIEIDTYDGQEHFARSNGHKLVSTDRYTVSGNIGFVDANTYDITLTLVDPENFA